MAAEQIADMGQVVIPGEQDAHQPMLEGRPLGALFTPWAFREGPNEASLHDHDPSEVEERTDSTEDDAG